MFSLEYFLTPHDLPEPPVPGSHGPAAEHYRAAALANMSSMKLAVESMDRALRTAPDDNVSFDVWADFFVRHVQAAANNICMFREVRDCFTA